jgi:transposase-like protein
VEVLQRYSKLEPISFDLCSERESADPPPARTAAPRVHKLDKRLDPAVVAELVAAYEAGTSATQLTKQYNVGKGSVLRLLHEAGVAIRQPRVMGQAEIDQAVQLYESGQSLQRVGDHLGWNHKTIYRQLKKRGVTMRSPNDWQY